MIAASWWAVPAAAAAGTVYSITNLSKWTVVVTAIPVIRKVHIREQPTTQLSGAGQSHAYQDVSGQLPSNR
jgi:hypothetical protein